MTHAKNASECERGRVRGRVRGFTLTELLVALCVALAVCGSLALLASDARVLFRVQPEAADLLQRARVGHETLADALSVAGAGLQVGGDTNEPKPLVSWIPAVLPYTRAVNGSDPEMTAFADRLTVLSVSDLAPQASLASASSGESASAIGTRSDVIAIAPTAACGNADATCGFAAEQRVLLFDATPAFDVATVSSVSLWRVQLASAPGAMSTPMSTPKSMPTSKAYRASDDARLVAATVTTFSFDAGRRQLRRSAGDGVDLPVLDEVVELSFQYFGDPIPPERPRPPPGEANCLFDAAGTTKLPVLAADNGSLTELPIASFADGPFCGVAPYRFDADLYRIRRVRVRLRLQTPVASLRGRDPLLFRIPGTAAGVRLQVPDMVVEFDIAPRNLQVR